MTSPTPPNDDDLSQYMTKQPPKQSRPPKREVSVPLRVMPLRVDKQQQKRRSRQASYSRASLQLDLWYGWIWTGLGLLAMFLITTGTPRDTVLFRREISYRNLANFPPPNPVQQITGTSISIANGSPEAMIIRLQGEENYVIQIPGCISCGYTFDPEVGSEYCNQGEEKVFSVQPGIYEARVTFLGSTRGVRSDWVIREGWHYSQCLFSTDTDLPF